MLIVFSGCANDMSTLTETASTETQSNITEQSDETVNKETESTETPGNIIEKKGEIAVIERGGRAIVIGFGNEPWIVPTDRGEVVNFETNCANDAMLLFVVQDGVDTMYYKTETQELRIENVDRFGSVISEDGNYFAYVVRDKDTDENTVMFYNNGVTEEIYSSDYYTFAGISPFGKTVSFTTLINNNVDSVTYVKIGDNIEKLGRNLEELYISDNAELIYYKEEESGNYYVQKGLDKENRRFICQETDDIYIDNSYNFDLSQAYYIEYLSDDERRTTFVADGGEPIKISDYYAYIDINTGHGNVDSVKDLTKAIWIEVNDDDEDEDVYRYMDQYTLFRLNSDYSKTIIAENVNSYMPTNSENICYYIKRDNLYKADPTNPDSEPILITDNAPKLLSSPDYKNLYILNSPSIDPYDYIEGVEGLYAVNPEGGKTLISETFDKAAADNEYLYYFDSGKLYKWDGENATQIGDFKENNELTVGDIVYSYGFNIAPDGSLVVWTPSGETYVRTGEGEFVNADTLE
jgi:hypothetical protein